MVPDHGHQIHNLIPCSFSSLPVILPDFLLGFSSVDCTTLTPPDCAREPLQRSYLLDLRLLEDPQRSASLELDIRLWGKNMRQEVLNMSPSHAKLGNTNYPSNFLFSSDGGGAAGAGAAPGPGGTFGAPGGASLPQSGAILNGSTVGGINGLQQQQQEFRLNQDLSIQLMREFNLRASALKSAGEEIVELRRAVQLLQNENSKLKMQIEEEVKFNEV